MTFKDLDRIYLDYTASTPIRNEVIDTIKDCLENEYGNPSSLHQNGTRSKLIIQRARNQISKTIGSTSSEIIFTSGATESNNFAIHGTIEKAIQNNDKRNHIITSQIEHDSILETISIYQKKGFKVSYLPVDKNGMVNEKNLLENLSPSTILVSIMFVNNEIGSIQPLKKLVSLVKSYSKEIIFHSDGVQALGKVPINVKDLDIDLMSFSSHKIYGPKGIGALYIKRGLNVFPLINGGGQQNNLRSGTENVCGIVGFGKACELISLDFKQICRLKEYTIQKLSQLCNAKINGTCNCVPHILNFSIPEIKAEDLIYKLDEKGVSVSTGSACSSNKKKASHVLKAIGLSHKEITGSIRLSIGIKTNEKEIDRFLHLLRESILELNSSVNNIPT